MLVEDGRSRDDDRLDLRSDRARDSMVLILTGVTQVDREPDWVFSELHDPETLLSCVPGGSLTRLIGPRRFEAQIGLGAGPFKFNYSGTGRIVDSNSEARTASMTLDAHPASNLPDIRIRMSMAVNPHARGSEIRMSFRVVLADRTGLLARTWVDPVACELLDRTIRRVKQRLEDTPLAPSPTAA
jgi:carbon monoxide dehydrogenase subunit G